MSQRTPTWSRPLSLLLFFFIIRIICGCNNKGQSSFRVEFPKNTMIDTLSLKNINQQILINTEIEGEKYPFVFDTGSDFTILGAQIPVKQTNLFSIINDFRGKPHHVDDVEIDTLYVGKIGFYHDKSYKQHPLVRDKKGILGGNIFKHFIWKLDFTQHKIYIAQSASVFGGGEEIMSVPFQLKGNKPYVTCEINGETIEFLLDTGFDGFARVRKDKLSQFNLSEEEIISWHGNSNKSGVIEKDTILFTKDDYIFGNLKIGGHVLRDELMVFTSDINSNVLGLDFIKRFNYIILNYPKQILHLGKKRHKSLAYLKEVALYVNSMGINISADSVPTIKRLSSWTGKSGIKLQDTIIGIDEISFLEKSISFYKDTIIPQKVTLYRNKMEKDTIINLPVISEFRREAESLYYEKDTAVVKIKRGNKIFTFTLTRKYNHKHLPNIVQDDYWPLEGAEKYLYDSSYKKSKDSVGKVYYLYIPKKLPSHVLKDM